MKKTIKRSTLYSKCIKEIPGKLTAGKTYKIIYQFDSFYFYKADDGDILCFHEFDQELDLDYLSSDEVISTALKGNFSMEKYLRFPSKLEYFLLDNDLVNDTFEVECTGKKYSKIIPTIRHLFRRFELYQDWNWHYVHQIETKSYSDKNLYIVVLSRLSGDYMFCFWDKLHGNINVGDIIVFNDFFYQTGFYKIGSQFTPEVDLPKLVIHDKYICIKCKFNYGEDLVGIEEIII